MTEQEELAHVLMYNAAYGDRTALVLMASACVASQFHGIPAFEAMVGAEAFARLAACHQDDPEGMLLLAGVLHIRASQLDELGEEERVRANRMRDEIGMLLDNVKIDGPSGALEFLTGTFDAAADGGDEQAAVWLNKLMTQMPGREAVKLAAVVAEAGR